MDGGAPSQTRTGAGRNQPVRARKLARRSVLWSSPVPPEAATVHALVIGVSRYDHLEGGDRQRCTAPLLGGLGQLSAAAAAATRVAVWLRDHFDYPDVRLGSVRLLASPSPGELPLPSDASPPPATYEEVKRALSAWRADARQTPGNITLLYVAGHGIQTSNEGGILLLQDAGDPAYPVLDRALDVASVRRGMVGDPNDPSTYTPPVQYYFYDACRVLPPAVTNYTELEAGLRFDSPRGAAADMSWVLWGSRSRDYAYADAGERTTLFSKALTEALEKRAQADTDGRTVRFAYFAMALEAAVDELAASFDAQQTVVSGGAGQLRTPVYLRPHPDRSGAPPLLPAPPVPSPTRPRPVRLLSPDLEPRGVTIRGMTEGGPVAVEGLTGKPIELLPGRYVASVDLPWGGTTEAEVEVPAGTEAFDVTVEVPSQPPGSTVDSPRLGRQLGPSGGESSRWYLRFLGWGPQGLQHRPENLAPAVEVDDLSDDTAAMIIHAGERERSYAQVRTEDGRSLVVAVPVDPHSLFSSTCWLHVRVSNTALGAVVRLAAPTMDACAGYLTGGRPDHVVALAPSAEGLLRGKVQDPIGAALGGYALVRLNELHRVRDWADNLANWFDWLPDGPVIAGEVAARRGEDDKARSHFEEASRRGLPLFSEGMSLYANRMPQLVGAAEGAQVEPLRALAQPLLSLCPSVEFGTLATTLHIDPDPGPIEAARGWRRFVPTRRAEDPRDFWREP